MQMRFWKNHELEDQQIINALRQAVDDYENGAVVEVRDTLIEIVNAINEFESETEKQS